MSPSRKKQMTLPRNLPVGLAVLSPPRTSNGLPHHLQHCGPVGTSRPASYQFRIARRDLNLRILTRDSREVAVNLAPMQDTHAFNLIALHSQPQSIVTDANSKKLRAFLQALQLGNLSHRFRALQRADDFLDTAEQSHILNRFQILRERASKPDDHDRFRRSRANTSARVAALLFSPSWIARPRPISSTASRNNSGRSLRISSRADLTWRFSAAGGSAVAITARTTLALHSLKQAVVVGTNL